jgi:hypothetical protein
MRKEIILYRDTLTGKITDNWGYEYSLPQREEAAQHTPPFRMESGDLSGDLTITGNLTVQQSQWVYLRGPITGSGALINGAITASNLWVRNRTGGENEAMEGMGYLRVDEDILLGGESVKGRLDDFHKVGVLEGELGRLEKKLSRVEYEVGELNMRKGNDGGMEEVKNRLYALGNRISFLEQGMDAVKKNKGDEGMDSLMGEFKRLEEVVMRRLAEVEDSGESKPKVEGDVMSMMHQLRDDVNIIMGMLHK